MNSATQFFSKFIEIDHVPIRFTKPDGSALLLTDASTLKMCNSIQIDDTDIFPIEGVDLKIYQDYVISTNQNIRVYGVHCYQNATGNKRPLFGTISYNIKYLESINLTSPTTFEEILHLTMREIIHIMGFSKHLFGSWNVTQPMT